MVRHLARTLPGLLLFCACAHAAETSDGPAAPPHSESNGAVADRIPDSRQPTQEELASAFEEPQAVSSSGKAQLTGTGKVEPVSPPPDLQAQDRADFPAKEAEVRALVLAKSPDAFGAAAALVKSADRLGPSYSVRALQLQTQAAVALNDPKRAHASAWQWLLSCGPENADRCRREAMGQLARTQKAAANPSRAKQQLEAQKKAQACLWSVEAAAKKKGEVPGCADDALRTFRNHDDRLMSARLLLARGRVKQADEAKLAEAERDYERVESECSEPRCVDVRRRALERLTWLHLRQNEPEEAARAALKAMQLHASTLPPEERPYAWTDEVAKACAAYDAQAGFGACRKLEQKVSGTFAFKDYSKGPATGDGLPPDVVREVNGHYGVTFTSCLADEANRLRPPAQERYTVNWVVLPDGRVGEMHMERKDQENTPLAECLRRQLGLWRYPRYQGEYQHVAQTFSVSAAVRRY